MRRRAGLAVVVVVAGVILWGGYGGHWSWAGINARTATLWDWLHLLLLPAAFALVPILLAGRRQLNRRHQSLGLTALSIFLVLVAVGYAVPWNWTGFSGNRLWDWLELLALPLAVSLTPILPDVRAAWGRHHTVGALAGGVLFVVVVLGGYLGDWDWTGFRGNTLWDWMHLLLLPLLLPTVVVPRLTPLARARLQPDEEPEEAVDEPLADDSDLPVDPRLANGATAP